MVLRRMEKIKSSEKVSDLGFFDVSKRRRSLKTISWVEKCQFNEITNAIWFKSMSFTLQSSVFHVEGLRLSSASAHIVSVCT